MAGWGRTLASVLPILYMTCVASPVTLRAQEAPAETLRLLRTRTQKAGG